jgi:hypothetical protein
MAGLQAGVTAVDANMLRRIRENVVRRTAVWIEMDGGRFEHLRQLRTAHGFSFDT